MKRLKLGKKKIFTYNDHSNDAKRQNIVEQLKRGLIGGIISDAGTPLISDPGYKLISELISNNINITSLPGPTAVITALTGSGLPTDKFQFNGFLPKKNKELVEVLNNCSSFSGTSIFYETPHRIINTLKLIDQIFDFKARLCVAKELSKAHENYFRGTAKKILDKFKANSQLVRGEFVLLIYFEKRDYDYAIADKLYKKLESKVAIGELSKLASDLTGINKNLLYKRFLSFSQKS